VEIFLALAGELDGLHQRDLVVADCVLGVHKGVVVWVIDLVVEEVGRGGEGFRDVCKYIGHCLLDASPVQVAVNPLAVLSECGKVEGFAGAILAEVGQLHLVAELVIERHVLWWEIGSS
jgi:hypothetical protein